MKRIKLSSDTILKRRENSYLRKTAFRDIILNVTEAFWVVNRIDRGKDNDNRTNNHKG